MASTSVKSGPALIYIYNKILETPYATADLDSAGVPKVLDRVDQLNDAMVRFERDQFPHQTQLSSKPVKYIQTGIEPIFDISIASITFENLREVFGVSSLTSYTAATPGNIATNTEDRVDLGDSAGSEIVGKCVQILPYPLLAEYDPSIATQTTNGWDPFEALNTAGYTAGPVTKAWLDSVITIPNAAVVDINATNLTFGLQTQQEFRISLKGLPNANGDRLFFGDYTL